MGDIPVQVNIFPDTGGADVLQLRGQLQLHHLAADHAHVGVNILFLSVQGGYPAKHDVVHAVHRAVAGRRLVGGRAVDYVGSHDKIQLPAGKQLPQPFQIVGIGNVDGDIIGKQLHMEFIRHRHGGDLPPDQAGLGLFRP